jgi:hypothetical protein
MAKWTVETRTEDERENLKHELCLNVIQTFNDGSILVDCPDPADEDDLVEYCDDTDLECSLS